MLNKSVLAAAEGVPNLMPVQKQDFLNAEDLISESAHLAQLVYMAVDSMELEAETRALSAGIWVIHRKLLDAAHLMDLAKQTPK